MYSFVPEPDRKYPPPPRPRLLLVLISLARVRRTGTEAAIIVAEISVDAQMMSSPPSTAREEMVLAAALCYWGSSKAWENLLTCKVATRKKLLLGTFDKCCHGSAEDRIMLANKYGIGELRGHGGPSPYITPKLMARAIPIFSLFWICKSLRTIQGMVARTRSMIPEYAEPLVRFDHSIHD